MDLNKSYETTMPLMPFICDLDSDTKTTLNVYLFKNVKNVEYIRNNIVKGDWNCAAIKPSLILDMFQVAVAANRAVLAEKTQSMVTRSVYAEILFNLSLSKNISQSLIKFGIEQDSNLLVCFLITAEKNDAEEIVKQIDGELCPTDELSKFTNIKDVKSVYKLNNLKCSKDLLDVIVSRMATKNFVTY